MKTSLSTIALLCFDAALAQSDEVFTKTASAKAVDNFKKKASIKQTANLNLQIIGGSATSFKIEHQDVPLDDLVPVSGLFAPGAKVLIDGVEQEPKVFLYESTGDRRVKVLLDNNKHLIKASTKMSVFFDCVEDVQFAVTGIAKSADSVEQHTHRLHRGKAACPPGHRAQHPVFGAGVAILRVKGIADKTAVAWGVR